jgi:hypothetical protein
MECTNTIFIVSNSSNQVFLDARTIIFPCDVTYIRNYWLCTIWIHQPVYVGDITYGICSSLIIWIIASLVQSSNFTYHYDILEGHKPIYMKLAFIHRENYLGLKNHYTWTDKFMNQSINFFLSVKLLLVSSALIKLYHHKYLLHN